MPRKAREFIDRPEALYHIVCRGNNKKRIFRRSEDYRRLLSVIRLAKKEFPFYFYSYNFLPNQEKCFKLRSTNGLQDGNLRVEPHF